MKECARCHKTKEYSEFTERSDRPGSYQSYCKACKASVARERKYYMASNKRNNAKTRVLNRALKHKLVAEKGGCCSRCGYNEFLAGLDFHHVGEKSGSVAALITAASRGNEELMEALLQEVDKCIILCKNCHMSLHASEWEL